MKIVSKNQITLRCIRAEVLAYGKNHSKPLFSHEFRHSNPIAFIGFSISKLAQFHNRCLSNKERKLITSHAPQFHFIALQIFSRLDKSTRKQYQYTNKGYDGNVIGEKKYFIIYSPSSVYVRQLCHCFEIDRKENKDY